LDKNERSPNENCNNEILQHLETFKKNVDKYFAGVYLKKKWIKTSFHIRSRNFRKPGKQKIVHRHD